MTSLIDTHCHLDLPAFDGDREAVLANCRVAGVDAIVVPGIEAAGWPRLQALCGHHAELRPAYGLHPLFVDRHRDRDLVELERRVADHAPVAVGEIGLDHFVAGLDRQRQLRLFEAQLAIARSAGLPVLLHVRKAHDEVLATLRRVPVVGGIAHAFNGTLDQARRYADLNFRLGFGGMLTYPRSRKLRQLARAVPAATLVLETDAPDLTVASHRGERNSPEYLPEVLMALAEVRDEGRDELARQTTANALSLIDPR